MMKIAMVYSTRRLADNDIDSTIKNKSSLNTLRFTIYEIFSVYS